MPHILIISSALFCIGLMAVLSRRSAVFVLIGIELMLAAANINFVAFWRAMPAAGGAEAQPMGGVMFVMFAIAIAAAEVAVGMALVLSVFRHRRTSDVSKLDQLKG